MSMDFSKSQILQGDAMEVLKTLPAESVHCVITSPPYYNLRDYGTASWEGGDGSSCNHSESELRLGANLAASSASTRGGAKKIAEAGFIQYKDVCAKCGATRADKQIGLEKLPDCLAWARFESPCDDCYVCVMRKLFAKLWRVLRNDGTVFLNLGDSYASKAGGYDTAGSRGTSAKISPKTQAAVLKHKLRKPPQGLKEKDLMMIPARVALALQSDGWLLRQDLIWHKSNPMPESVTDRCTKSHEYIFLLTKRPKYYFDNEAIRQPYAEKTKTTWGNRFQGHGDETGFIAAENWANSVENHQPHFSGKANKRSVWTVATKPFPDSHFAVFPPELIEPCILAGTSEYGACADCGAPYERIIEKKLTGRKEN